MSKKITHNEAREILNKIYYYYPDIPRQYDLEEYFKQQEKLELEEYFKQQEKLNKKRQESKGK